MKGVERRDKARRVGVAQSAAWMGDSWVLFWKLRTGMGPLRQRIPRECSTIPGDAFLTFLSLCATIHLTDYFTLATDYSNLSDT
jgi:hypothetical protein